MSANAKLRCVANTQKGTQCRSNAKYCVRDVDGQFCTRHAEQFEKAANNPYLKVPLPEPTGVRSATDLLLLIESTLGWAPVTSEAMPLWKARTINAGRINKKVATNPKLYTWRNLELAVELLRRKNQPIRGPLAVFYYVEDAVKLANQRVERPLEELVEHALTVEYARDDAEADKWAARFVTAFGYGRKQVYEEWKAAGRDS